MRGKNALTLSVILSSLMALAILPAFAPASTLAAPDIYDTTLGPYSTFSIDITIDDVSAMWGYNFKLVYDTNVLTAIGYGTYAPFNVPWPSEINDTGGYVLVAYSMKLGELVGFSTTTPAPIARIDFSVDAYGWSFFDIQDSVVSDIYGNPIAHIVDDGFFANIIATRQVNLVGKSAWPEHHHWVMSKDPDQELFGKAAGIGSVGTFAYVKFTVHNEDGIWQATFVTETVLITPGEKRNLSVAVTPAQLVGPGKYYVSAQAWYDDGTGTFVAGTKIKTFTFAAVP